MPKTKGRIRPAPGISAANVFHFTNAIRNCRTLQACAASFRKAILPYGFNGFACGEADVVKRSRSVIFIADWPTDFLEIYVKHGYVDRDPMIDELPRFPGPFTWSELLRDKKLSKPTREMLATVASYGWTEGFVVTFRHSESRFGLVSLAGHRGPLSLEDADRLAVMSICLYNQTRRIGPQVGVSVALSALTLRELDGLRLVARGLTDKEIAVELGIAASTAREHVETAKRKLKVRNRAEAAAVAVSLGLA